MTETAYIELRNLDDLPRLARRHIGNQIEHQVFAVIVLYDDDPDHDNQCEGSMCYCKSRKEEREKKVHY